MLSLLALASSACWGTSDFFAGLVSRRRPPVAVVGWTQALGFLVISVVVLTQLGSVPWSGWPWWAVGAGLSGLVGLLCFYTALSTGTMGVVAPVAALGVAVPVLLGVATGDDPSRWTWVGITVAVVGVTFASGPELSGDVSARPVVLAGVAAVGFGLALFCIDRGARTSTLMTMWGMRATSVTVFVVLALVTRRLGGMTAREGPALLGIGCADLGANVLFGLASSGGEVSVASVLGSLYPVVTILLARGLLKERLRTIQKVGALLSLAGAAVIAM
ncbi:MAG TPA: DMT family transporter [Pedococcus sp.]|jgi:drug/metabolite transporter (DMT)-like permease